MPCCHMAKKRFTVELIGMAYVRQRRNVMAVSREEAIKKAKDTHNDHIWDYQGMDDSTIQVEARDTSEAKA